MTNLFTKVAIKPLYAPVVATTAVTSSALDVSGYDGVTLHVYYGDSADTLAAELYWSAKIKECATENGTYTDVAADDILGAPSNEFGLINAPTEDQNIYSIGYNGSQPFVKVVVTPTGVHASGTEIGIFAALGLPRSLTTEFSYNP